VRICDSELHIARLTLKPIVGKLLSAAGVAARRVTVAGTPPINPRGGGTGLGPITSFLAQSEDLPVRRISLADILPLLPPIPRPSPPITPVHCQSDVIKAMKTAWGQSANGTSGAEAGFRLDGTPRSYRIVPNAYTNEWNRQRMTIQSNTFAIFHVHSSSRGGNPSTPDNNEAGNREGDTGLVDRLFRRGQLVQIYVIHRTGLTMYDPSIGHPTRLRENLDWTNRCP